MKSIIGNTIGTPIKPEKNLVKATALTEAEKAQVRENIGAAAVGEGGSVDLSNYYTKAEVQSLIDTAIDNIPVWDGSFTKGVL